MKRHIGATIALLSPLMILGQPANGVSDFHSKVVATYSFSPHTIPNDQLTEKSAVLDKFWGYVKGRGQSGVDDLRHQLSRDDTPVFFKYDGAKLLLSLSDGKQDHALALAAISRCDTRDVQSLDYFLTVHAFAVEGLDTTDAAFKILEQDDFQVFIAQHSLTLPQEACFIYLLLPTNESYYLARAKDRLFLEKRVEAQKSLLALLAYTVTKQGDEAIARFAADSKQPTESRAYARKIIESTAAMEKSGVLGMSTKSYDSLKAEQRKLLARVSDEALGEWEHLKLKIRHKAPKS